MRTKTNYFTSSSCLLILLFLSFTFYISCGNDDNKSNNNNKNITKNNNNVEKNNNINVNSVTKVVSISNEQELISGPEARGRVGDYLLENSKCRFIVQDIGINRGWSPYGAVIVDAELKNDDGTTTGDYLYEIIPIVAEGAVAPRTLYPKEVIIVKDGSEGAESILRFKGKDGGIHVIDAATNGIITQFNLDVTVDYILEPDADYLKIKTTIKNNNDETVEYNLGEGLIYGDFMNVFIPGYGDNIEDASGKSGFEHISAYSEFGISFMWFATQSEIRIPLTEKEVVLVTQRTPEEVLKGTEKSFTRYLLLGNGSVESLIKRMRQVKKVNGIEVGNLFKISGRVLEDDLESDAGKVLSEIEVILESEEKDISLITSDETGNFEFEVTKGTYAVRTRTNSRHDVRIGEIIVDAANVLDVVLKIGKPGIINYKITDDQSNLIPSKITLQAGSSASSESGIIRRFFTDSGEGELAMVPGNYTATVSRGLEYGVYKKDLIIEPGLEVDLNASLIYLDSSTGYISADFHIHATDSIDSSILKADRVKTALSEGLELMVNTDHDFAADYSQVIKDMGVEKFVKSAVGCEISPLYGHINAFPIALSQGDLGFWPVPWWEFEDGVFKKVLEPVELVDLLFSELEVEVVQINHPRSDQGLFDSYRYDYEQGVASLDANEVQINFNAMEIINGKRSDATPNTLKDWYSLLNQGYKVTATGNSDSHSEGQEIGFPRNMVRVNEDDIKLLELQKVWDAVKQGRIIVTGGAFLDVYISDGNGNKYYVGDMAPSDNGNVDLSVNITAPKWININKLNVIVNGQEQVSEDFTALENDKGLLYESKIDLHVDIDSWISVNVSGVETMDPVVTGETPFSFTNPIYIDADNDGNYTAPGL